MNVIAEFITHLKGLKPTNRIAGAFGSYGWGGGAVRWLYNEFKSMKLKTVEPGIEVVYRPSSEDMVRCYEFGKKFARRVIEYQKTFNQEVVHAI